MDHFSTQSRRAFLQRSAMLGMAGAAAPFVGSLAAIGEAAAATASDYKALVCLFMYGGNDYANTLTPYDAPSYARYQAARPTVAHQRDNLAATLLSPSVGLDGGRQYALAPTMNSLLPLFDAGKMAPILNIGTLVEPTTKDQYARGLVRLPPKLFSHNDQQSFFQASSPEGAPSGWGGRIGDVFQAGNGNAALTCINLAGNAVFLSGRQAVQFSLGGTGPVPLIGNSRTVYGSSKAATALQSLLTESHPHVFADEHARITKRSLDTYASLSGALANTPSSFSQLPGDNPFTGQLQMVARMIAASSQLGLKRQVFMVGMGGFDHHDGLEKYHPSLIGWVASALRGFYDTTVALGVANQVTTFTASDFGRTLVANEDGSDHGWGSMHFVLGGAVRGGRFYGKPPEIGNDTADDVGQGRLLPTTSVDQYAATLASWFGVSGGELSTVIPNIGNYNSSSINLGFMG